MELCPETKLEWWRGEREHKAPKKVVCPKCKRRLKPRIRECQDTGCWHMSVPPHKPKKWWKK